MRSPAITAAAALVAAAAGALPAAAQQPPPSGGAPLSLALPPYPVDTGKPVIWDPRFVAKSDSDNGCTPGLSCRVQLLGVIRHNGAVELRATAFTW